MRKTLFAFFMLGFIGLGAVLGQDFRGTYTLTSGGITLTLVLEQDASGKVTGSLTSTAGTRFLLEGAIEEGVAAGTCPGASGQVSFEAEFEGKVLVFTLTQIDALGQATSRSMEFTRVAAGAKGASKTPPAPKPSVPSPAAPVPTDNSLMKYFAGEYYFYSSGSTLSGGAGTERTVTLCPDGSYRDSYEFSASGGGWGGANSQAGAARWTIQGDTQQGAITVVFPNGQTKTFAYRVVSKKEGTILFDGIQFAFAGAPKCR